MKTAIVVAWMMAIGMAPVMAQPKPLVEKKPAPTQQVTKKQYTASDVQANPLLVLQNIAATDLQLALDDANAQTPPDIVGAQCYSGLLAIKSSLPDMTKPVPSGAGIFYAVQRARDLKQAILQMQLPTGPMAQINLACAAWNNDNVATLIGIGVAGGMVINPAGGAAAVASLPVAIAAWLAAHPLIP